MKKSSFQFSYAFETTTLVGHLDAKTPPATPDYSIIAERFADLLEKWTVRELKRLSREFVKGYEASRAHRKDARSHATAYPKNGMHLGSIGDLKNLGDEAGDKAGTIQAMWFEHNGKKYFAKSIGNMGPASFKVLREKAASELLRGAGLKDYVQQTYSARGSKDGVEHNLIANPLLKGWKPLNELEPLERYRLLDKLDDDTKERLVLHDFAIGAHDRSASNVMINPRTGKIKLIDYELAFEDQTPRVGEHALMDYLGDYVDGVPHMRTGGRQGYKFQKKHVEEAIKNAKAMYDKADELDPAIRDRVKRSIWSRVSELQQFETADTPPPKPPKPPRVAPTGGRDPEITAGLFLEKWEQAVDRTIPLHERQYERLNKQNSEGVNRQSIAVRGVKAYEPDDEADRIIRRSIETSLSKMKNVGPDFVSRALELVSEGHQKGWSAKRLGEELEKATGLEGRRARFVARNEMGNANAALTEMRQTENDAPNYIWQTSEDERVVGYPGGFKPSPGHQNHYERNGKQFAWDQPPGDGHPGQAYNCRCVAIPVFEDFDETPDPEPSVEQDLRRLRELAGMSRRQLADEMGKSTSWLSNIENGHAKVKKSDYARLRQVLANNGVDQSELDKTFGRLGPTPPPQPQPVAPAPAPPVAPKPPEPLPPPYPTLDPSAFEQVPESNAGWSNWSAAMQEGPAAVRTAGLPFERVKFYMKVEPDETNFNRYGVGQPGSGKSWRHPRGLTHKGHSLTTTKPRDGARTVLVEVENPFEVDAEFWAGTSRRPEHQAIYARLSERERTNPGKLSREIEKAGHDGWFERSDDGSAIRELRIFDQRKAIGILPPKPPSDALLAAEAIERLRMAPENEALRGVPLKQSNYGGSYPRVRYFEDDQQVSDLVAARREHELRRFPGLRKVGQGNDAFDDEILELETELEGTKARIREATGATFHELANRRREIRARLRTLKAAAERPDPEVLAEFERFMRDLIDANPKKDKQPEYRFIRFRNRAGNLVRTGQRPGWGDPREKNDGWVSDEKRRLVERGMERLTQYFGDAIPDNLNSIDLAYTASRGYQSSGEKYINLGDSPDQDRLVMHEVFHQVEDENKVLSEASRRYLLAKAAENNATTGSTHWSGNGENGFIGAFNEKYATKIYMGGYGGSTTRQHTSFSFDDLHATEVSTMAVQEFVTDARAMKLLEEDPDLFWWAVSMSRGDLNAEELGSQFRRRRRGPGR